MESEPRVKDLMRKQFEKISPDASLRDAVAQLYVAEGTECHPGIPGAQSLIVQDSAGKLVGMLTMLDIMEGIEPQYLHVERTYLAGITWEGLFEEAIQRAESRTVSSVMTPRKDFSILSPEDRIMKALELMVAENAPRLPVCEEGRVVGVIRMYEIFQAVARAMSNKLEERN